MDMADYLDVTGDTFSDLRVLVEGALSLIEDYTGSLNRLATEAGMEEARTALNDVCGALYTMRQHIKKLQAAHLKHLLESPETDEPPKADD